MGVCRPKGSRGRPQTFVCFHCPLVASAEAKSPRNNIKLLFFQQSVLTFLSIWSLPRFQRAFRSPSGLLRRSPPQRRFPPAMKKTSTERNLLLPMLVGRANGRDNVEVVDRASWGALLRERKVTGRDASLPAPLLSAFGILVARETVGALPQTPQGTPPLDPAREEGNGTKSLP